MYTARTMQQSQRVMAFIETIWDWYARHKRELPWRDMHIDDDAERAYRVLVSEVMLQQTQVARVKVVFKEFLETFPRLEDLAHASNSQIIRAWRGMGYNSRALRLRDAAREIVARTSQPAANSLASGYELRAMSISFPKTMPDLLAIKGIGPYTAAAVLNFAFNIPTPCIDTNIRRILHRTFYGPENVDGSWSVGDGELLELAGEVLDAAVDKKNIEYRLSNIEEVVIHDARNWHAALMDFGSLVQTKNNPKWDICPLTHAGIMLATPENWQPLVRGEAKKKMEKEPGRFVGSSYIPNRIFRGKVVEVLRDHYKGMVFEDLGKEVCLDWSKHLKPWFRELLQKLIADELLVQKGEKYVLS